MIVSVKDILEKAQKGGYAVGAFNTSTFEATKAVLEAAEEANKPVIIETSEGEANYLGMENFVALVTEMAEKISVDVAINLDHGKSQETINKAIDAGYTSVHIDGSEKDKKENIELTKRIVAEAHQKNISVEGEFNAIGGSSEAHDSDFEAGEATSFKEAIAFIEETGIDVFAGSYGNVHGIFNNNPNLDIDRIREINAKSDCFLSLHGGSGIEDNQIREAIEAGIRKINVNTELRMAYRRAIEKTLKDKKNEIVPYHFLPEVISEIKNVVLEKIKLFSLE